MTIFQLNIGFQLLSAVTGFKLKSIRHRIDNESGRGKQRRQSFRIQQQRNSRWRALVKRTSSSFIKL